MKRRKMDYRSSQKYFTRTADRSHRYNLNHRPMRGGTRL